MNKIEAIKKRVQGEAAYEEMRGASQDHLHIKWLLEVVEEATPIIKAYLEYTRSPNAETLLTKINEEEETPNAK